MTKRTQPAAAAAEEIVPASDQLPAGGAYVDGQRVEGPTPEYGWLVQDGKRVRAPGPGVNDG